MARYYFDTRDRNFVRDDCGIECKDLDQVLAEAMSGLADFAYETISATDGREVAVEVRDEANTPVLQAILRLQINFSI